jgi:predicted nucleotidyltransferase
MVEAIDGLRSAERIALGRFARGMRARFGARLLDLRLFGSRARGEGHEESDVDVLVVVDGLTWAEGREITDLTGDLLTEHEVLISPFAVSAEHWARLRRLERRIVAEIDRDGVAL